MGGRGWSIGNSFIEHLWRSLKQGAEYLEEIADGFQVRRVIGNWMTFYNTGRPHSFLKSRTPCKAYRHDRSEKLAALTNSDTP